VYHRRKTYKLYQQRKKLLGCPFCDPAEISYRIREETPHFYVILNNPPYFIWEHHHVLEHLLVIPKRHVDTLNDFSDAELLEYGRITGRYETKDYSIYARSDTSPRRSVTHQHTHLIKIDRTQPRFSLYIRKPYILFHK
jgi:diadenosine tetraphosphate (Ap4A) HIT family hydrolase